jgi:hypothetical protein
MATKGSVDEVLVSHMASGRLRPVMDATSIYMRLLCFTREGQLRSLAPEVWLGGALPLQPACHRSPRCQRICWPAGQAVVPRRSGRQRWWPGLQRLARLAAAGAGPAVRAGT